MIICACDHANFLVVENRYTKPVDLSWGGDPVRVAAHTRANLGRTLVGPNFEIRAVDPLTGEVLTQRVFGQNEWRNYLQGDEFVVVIGP